MSAPTLKDLCAKAVSGPWHLDGNHLLDASNQNSIAVFAAGWSDDEPTMQLIARLSPDVALAVYEALEFARDEAASFVKVAACFEDDGALTEYRANFARYDKALALLDARPSAKEGER